MRPLNALPPPHFSTGLKVDSFNMPFLKADSTTLVNNFKPTVLERGWVWNSRWNRINSTLKASNTDSSFSNWVVGVWLLVCYCWCYSGAIRMNIVWVLLVLFKMDARFKIFQFRRPQVKWISSTFCYRRAVYLIIKKMYECFVVGNFTLNIFNKGKSSKKVKITKIICQKNKYLKNYTSMDK